MNRLSRFCIVCCVVIASRPVASARAQETHPVTVDLVVASATIDRTATAVSATAAAASRAADIGLLTAFGDRVKPRDKAAIAARLAKLTLLDIPLAHFAVGLNHEVGHMSWARQDGARLDFRLTGGPWSSNVFDLRCSQPDAALTLDTYGGGFDAEFLLERRMWDRIEQEGRSSVSDGVFLLDGAIGRFYYIQQSLALVDGWAHHDLGYATGDPTRYVYRLVGERDHTVTASAILTTAESVKRRSWLNFADYGLWGQAVNLVRYVASGQEAFAPRWLKVKGVGLSPFARYHLSPVGPQTVVGTHYRAGHNVGDVSVHWTEPVNGARFVGASVAWAATGGTVVDPHVRTDIWRDATGKQGLSLETGITATRWPSSRARLRLSIGAKTKGYAVGLPPQATVFGEAGMRVRF